MFNFMTVYKTWDPDISKLRSFINVEYDHGFLYSQHIPIHLHTHSNFYNFIVQHYLVFDSEILHFYNERADFDNFEYN